jgi:hydrogenase maturation protein HypF
MLNRAHIFVNGLVQGVGFRPFIYTIAVNHALRGYVLNLGDAGVEIVAEGEDPELIKFIEDIKNKKPTVSRIDEMHIEWTKPTGEFNNFRIAESNAQKLSIRSVIPTDLSICDICITDIHRNSRWHNYPFTSCAQCGPRFTMIHKLPYDRENTSMVDFPLCPHCKAEYDDPQDRRYDAQGVTCPICGPRLSLLDKNSTMINCEPIHEAVKLLNEGYIIAVKGIGGFHICVDATNESSVSLLRKRRIRPLQPFAVMSRSVEKIKKFALMSDMEQALLTNIFHPIVTLNKSKNYSLADSVSPGLDSIGVMLPYSGIHLLILDLFDKDALVMTSGNYPGKPIFIDNQQVLKELHTVVDYFLIHNRTIVNRCDDSVIKVVDHSPIFLRKSRGYAPSSLAVSWKLNQRPICALGGEFNVTASLFSEDRIVTTQHIGDTEEIETMDYLKKALTYISKNYNIDAFSCIAHDLNPAFLTTRFAQELADEYKTNSLPVQHHHAHLASLMADNFKPKNAEIVCIAIDGFGYGVDGMAWGGEILVGGYSHFERAGHLKYQPMPGADLCAKYPARMLAAILSTIMSESEITRIFENKFTKYFKHGIDELNIILKQAKNSDGMKTSSLGRLLDSIAAFLDICWLRTYEGEPPMRLEGLAKQGKLSDITLSLPISHNRNAYILDTSEFIRSICENSFLPKQDLAFEAHRILGKTLADVACSVCNENKINEIGLVGGSAVNSLLYKIIKETIIKNNKQFLFYKTVPCGDEGISTGQAVIASCS